MKYLMFYEMAVDGMAKAQENFPGHQARLKEFHERGTLLMAGPYGVPPIGALGIFTSREAAEEFAAGDPFVINGVVGKYLVQQWSEVLAPL
ncbi:hypothetical protein GCM10011613_29710 [Cellvibrio zantedeschiae]|uniref:YCII-related domain-containing protein n=1 Tax=Cellvibrio zantedeschiae TaxID=1237077 RepID=A0ABQ3B7J0_9GAMM|nr:YciI family protein [Cellvibrio zantedeschiae]GGY82923.1 hypothetical protein GCM10011613_29710 [Cellvibrio zantedeschiae]